MMKDMPSVTRTCPSGFVFNLVSTENTSDGSDCYSGTKRRHPDVQAIVGAQRRRPEIGPEHEEGAVRQVC